jgi:predicted acylesterase/phospholipase RssA
MIETLEDAARKASKRLSRADREHVNKYLQRLRLLQELSRDFARYDVQCRVPMRRALDELSAIAFCGGGVLGTAYVGALSVLEQHGLDYARVKRFAGTSAGAIMASTLAVGYRAAGCMKQLQRLNFEDLMTPDLSALTRGRGLSSGKYLEEWMGQVLAEQTGDPNITMSQVLERYGKELVIVTTELDTGRERKLTPHTDPDLPVKSAVRMSAGIPIVFDVYNYQGHQYCDGGLVNNWPVDALPQDGTGLGMVTFSFNDFIHYELYHLLWGPIPPETRSFDYERIGHAFAQALYSHSEKTTTIFGVATRSMRIIYDRLTREQIYRYAERWPGGLSMPRASFLCVGEYGALDTDISTTGQLELFEMGRLSMYVEVQRFMHELEYANTHSGSSIRDLIPSNADLYRERVREASVLGRESPSNPEADERAAAFVSNANAAVTAPRGDLEPHRDTRQERDIGNTNSESVIEPTSPVRSGETTPPLAAVSPSRPNHVHFASSAADQSDASLERQQSLSDESAVGSPRRLWQAPEELFWRHIFLLSLREGRKLGPQVHARLFPSRLRRRYSRRGFRAEAIMIKEDITRQVRSIWQNLRLCGVGCFALTIQCATCCQVARCVKDDIGFDDVSFDSTAVEQTASEATSESRT